MFGESTVEELHRIHLHINSKSAGSLRMFKQQAMLENPDFLGSWLDCRLTKHKMLKNSEP